MLVSYPLQPLQKQQARCKIPQLALPCSSSLGCCSLGSLQRQHRAGAVFAAASSVASGCSSSCCCKVRACSTCSMFNVASIKTNSNCPAASPWPLQSRAASQPTAAAAVPHSSSSSSSSSWDEWDDWESWDVAGSNITSRRQGRARVRSRADGKHSRERQRVSSGTAGDDGSHQPVSSSQQGKGWRRDSSRRHEKGDTQRGRPASSGSKWPGSIQRDKVRRAVQQLKNALLQHCSAWQA